jgi:hypothetical protein
MGEACNGERINFKNRSCRRFFENYEIDIETLR